MKKLRINESKIESLETRYRTQLINSIGGFKSAVLIGTKNTKGEENLAIFNSIFHLGAHPPLFGFIIRPDISPRHSLENIMENKYFSVNHILEDWVEKAHQTSARYANDVSEFDAVGLTPEYWDSFQAPLVLESKIKWMAQLEEIHPITINQTHLVIAKMIEISLPENCILSDGFVDLEQAGTITVSGLDSYHATRKIGRFSYAKPNVSPNRID